MPTSPDRVWLQQYPSGVPHTIDPDRYASLPALFEEAFERYRERRFAVCMERWMTYGELDRLSKALGAWLQSLGLPPGARVALMLPNVLQFPVTMAAVLRAGFTCVNVNPLYTARELEHQLNDSGATVIVILENVAHTLADAIARTPIQHVVLASLGDLLGPLYGRWVTFAARHLAKRVPAFKLPLAGGVQVTAFSSALAAGRKRALQPVTVQGHDVAFLQYTGGTTGLSKGAVLTHRNAIAAVLQSEAWFLPALSRVGDPGRINAIAALPLYHIFALNLCLLTIRLGAHMTLVPNPRDFARFIETLKTRPFHLLPGVNTLFNALMQQPQFKSIDFSHLCITQAGGMAASEGTARKWFKLTGCPMVEGWGMSETVAIGTNNPVTSREFNGTIGLPLPSIDVAIKDEAGHSLPIGSTGEICIQGPNVMAGYHNQPTENAKVFTADGYLRTGDVGTMDERGFIRIVDRLKDMIIVSGFNVYPTELENVVSLCPGVLECAAVGIPDAAQGEAVKLYVVRSDPSLSEADVTRYCHDKLTGYKRPRVIEFRDELPKSNVGKILRRELRQATA